MANKTTSSTVGMSPFDWIRAGNVTILDKSGNLVPLVLNAEQQELMAHQEECYKARRPCRQLVLKPRQVGVSTEIGAVNYAFWRTTTGWNALVASHETESCDDLWSIYQRFLDNDDAYARKGGGAGRQKSRDGLRYNSKRQVKDAGRDCEIVVRVAKGKGLGRSGTRRSQHLSEFPYWRDPAGSLQAALQCVPDAGFSLVVLESTSANPDDDFEKMFREAMAKGYEGDWKAFFFPWFKHAEYTDALTPEQERDFLRSLTVEEKSYIHRFKLTAGQMHWRRRKITAQFSGSVEQFQREYPGTVDEAFAATRKSMFNADSLDWYTARSRLPVRKAECGTDYRKIHWISDSDTGRLRVYAPPSPNAEYVVAADASGGEETTDDKVSESGAHVIDKRSGEVVATWQGMIDPWDFAGVLNAIGRIYNNALMVPEINQQGHAVVHRLNRDLHYPNMYRREMFDQAGKTVTLKSGWDTKSGPRDIALGVLQHFIKDRTVGIWDIPTHKQMRAFVEVRQGRYQAAGKLKDDLVIALAIGVFVASQGRVWTPKDPKIAAALNADPSRQYANTEEEDEDARYMCEEADRLRRGMFSGAAA